MVQGELFREDSSYELKASSHQSFLSKYRLILTLDKVLLLLIVFIFAFTLSYSFGVERGKRLMEKKFESLIPAQTKVFSQTASVNEPNEIVESETVLKLDKNVETPPAEGSVIKLSNPMPSSVKSETPSPVSSSQMTSSNQTTAPSKSELKKLGKFTVQLVTYDDKSRAEKEISRLKLKGYDGFIIPSGRYYQVCANYFDDKSNARSHLEELKQMGRYPDAYIRPVIR